MTRSSGILLHISSLSSSYGIGTVGEAAYKFADFLCAAKQSYWQMLPVGETSVGDSPYQSFSTNAGNPYFIDLDMLASDGLLSRVDFEGIDWGKDDTLVDYGKLYESRKKVLYKAYLKGYSRDKEEVERFRAENSEWIEDYALFMALKEKFGMRSWLEWEDEAIRMREDAAMKKYRDELAKNIEYYIYVQFLFFKQWKSFKEYANGKGIKLIGDLPIYVSPDSADLWKDYSLFLVNEERRPSCVAGVPPDYFNSDGQLWGNPIYDWAAMEKDGFGWWIRRLKAASKMFDVVRIDHFRGLESYWEIPVGETTAKNGKWIKGPGKKLIDVIHRELPTLSIIAEDLGYLTDGVRELVRYSGYPGMKVLQFAFDSREPANYTPHTYTENSVCYTGTHDNNTALGWLSDADAADAELARAYCGLNKAEGESIGLIRSGMFTPSALFVAPLQDWLKKGASARMNTPGTLGGNWQWRMKKGEADEKLAEQIAYFTTIFGRAN